MEKKIRCPFCGVEAFCYPDHSDLTEFYECPICGRFELKSPMEDFSFDRNHLAAYLTYHKFERRKVGEYRYHTVRDKEFCDKYRQEFDNGNNVCGRPVHMDADMVENWYPKTFSEKINRILLFFNRQILHIGQEKSFGFNELLNAMFVDRQEINNYQSNTSVQWIYRDHEACTVELDYMLRYLEKCSYIEYSFTNRQDSYAEIRLTPEGYSRVDELQKNTSYGRSVLVAMEFGDDTLPLRKAIKKGITNAGYVPILIDEVQHNDFITPELLKHIRDSKFVVVDLTHQNNGAYFEEGYAMGLGKPVIQLCKRGVQLHFDIAQKNTIIWETEDEIPQRLCNRIKATIE